MKETDQEKLVKIIKKLNMTKVMVAEYLGVSERTIYRWEYGYSRIPHTVFLALELLLKSEV
jgi:hypothetical protein